MATKERVGPRKGGGRRPNSGPKTKNGKPKNCDGAKDADPLKPIPPAARKAITAKEVTLLARKYANHAVTALVRVIEHNQDHPMAVIKASEALLEWGYGAPSGIAPADRPKVPFAGKQSEAAQVDEPPPPAQDVEPAVRPQKIGKKEQRLIDAANPSPETKMGQILLLRQRKAE